MQTPEYRECLMNAVQNLRRMNESIFASMVDIMMTGEMREWNRNVPIGESHQFEFSLFKNSDDTNIVLLAKTMEYVDQTYQSICNLSSINLNDEE